jgi:flagellar hook assembly protein FlgD
MAAIDNIGIHTPPAIDPTQGVSPSYRDGVVLREPGKDTDPVASKETFLKLLVAQIRNQNPMNPADGIQFVTQLAQFTELEQMIAMRQDMSAVRQDLDQAVTPPAPTEKP